MKRFKGYVLAPGFARGKAWLLSPVLGRVVPRHEVAEADRDAEARRLDDAVVRARADLEELKERLAARVTDADTGVLDAHIAMLEDPVFLQNVRERIRHEGANTEQAVSDEIDAMAALFSQLESNYLRERADDLRDVGRRLLDALMGPEEGSEIVEIPPNSIVVARELLPSQAAEMDRSRVAGIVTATGGSSSHAAILARSLGVPFVAGIENVLQVIPQGAEVLVDGDRGEVVCRPDDDEGHGFDQRKDRYDRFLASARLEEEQPSQTKDGVTVELWGNVASPEEADAVVQHHLAGIGLMRTEFIFMGAEKAPTIAAQHEGYRRIIERTGNAPATIRCMDLGGDKIPRFLMVKGARENFSPARGLRFALEHPTALRKQFRAMVRCAAESPVRVLLPMVAGGVDLERALEVLDKAVEAEGAEARPPVGAMIETPAALFELDAILEHADFLSVGTNDLTQYMLAVDRTASDAEGYYSVLYPGVLRGLKRIIDRAAAAGKPLSICGEAAGHPLIAPLFAGMGVRELSMSPARAAAVRHVIRASRMAELEGIAEACLDSDRVETTRHILDERIRPWLLDGEPAQPGVTARGK